MFMKKISTFLLGTFFAASMLIFPVSADRTLPLVVDDAALLTEYERQTLSLALEDAADEISAEIAIVTVTDTYGKSAMDYADDFYDENGYGYGDGDDGVLLLVNMGAREWWITTHGTCETVLSDNVLYTIENAFIDDLSSANYYDALFTFAERCYDYIDAANNGIILETESPYDYDYGYDYGTEDDTPSSPLDFILPSIVAGFIVSFIMVSVMKSGMKTVSSQISASSYLVDNSLRLSSSSDNYLYSNVTRTPRQTSSHGGGTSRSSGGSHRSSSGRSHGGRGGRF